MNYTFLSLHKTLFFIFIATITFVVGGVFSIGITKATSELDLLDAVGEGGITLMTIIWLFFTLLSRPAGRVTNLLFVGLTLTHISMLLDFLDEFLRYPPEWTWLNTIESLPAPLGMIIMTVALFHWHQEQNTINNQLRRTERFYREHSLTDFITGLYSADYMKNQIKLEVNNAKAQRASFTLVMLDIRQFAQFNFQYGSEQGDSLLREIAQLITMNIRHTDLACRYASDRFIVLMPNTDKKTAEEIAHQIKLSVEHLAFKLDSTSKAVYPKVITCSHQYRGWNNYEEILSDINQHLSTAKQHGSQNEYGELSA